MVTVIKKGTTPKRLLEKIDSIQKKKNKDIKALCGSVKLEKDPLELQKRWRDEWQ